MSDITPLVSSDHKLVDSYGNNGFKISGLRYQGSVLLFPHQVYEWGISDITHATFEDFIDIIRLQESPPTVLFIGTGKTVIPISTELRARLRKEGIVVEVMGTGAACRTFNITMAEERLVAAALIAID